LAAVNFITAMPNDDYAIGQSVTFDNTGSVGANDNAFVAAPYFETVYGFRVCTAYTDNARDCEFVRLTVVG
jgi:hypothetical protein